MELSLALLPQKISNNYRLRHNTIICKQFWSAQIQTKCQFVNENVGYSINSIWFLGLHTSNLTLYIWPSLQVGSYKQT